MELWTNCRIRKLMDTEIEIFCPLSLCGASRMSISPSKIMKICVKLPSLLQSIHHWHHEPGHMLHHQPSAASQLPLGAVCQPHGTRQRLPGTLPTQSPGAQWYELGHTWHTPGQDCWLGAQGVAASEQVPGNTQLVRCHHWWVTLWRSDQSKCIGKLAC